MSAPRPEQTPVDHDSVRIEDAANPAAAPNGGASVTPRRLALGSQGPIDDERRRPRGLRFWLAESSDSHHFDVAVYDLRR